MRILRVCWLVLLSLGLTVATVSPLQAYRTVEGVEVKQKKQWNWLSKDDKKQLLQSIPPAPAAGSPTDQADLAEVLKLQASRTRAEIAEAMFDKTFRLEIVTHGVLNSNFSPQNFPITFKLLQHVNEDESLLNSTLKNQYARPRPFAAQPEVHPLFKVEQFSYPSGHASGSRILADILGELFPAKKAALLARADAVAHGRVIAGVHYPSDIKEGAQLAQALSDALLANPAFQTDLAAAKAEIAQKQNLL
jgi:acid phosphatase (class A)